jgi:hypothetical protein
MENGLRVKRGNEEGTIQQFINCEKGLCAVVLVGDKFELWLIDEMKHKKNGLYTINMQDIKGAIETQNGVYIPYDVFIEELDKCSKWHSENRI